MNFVEIEWVPGVSVDNELYLNKQLSFPTIYFSGLWIHTGQCNYNSLIYIKKAKTNTGLKSIKICGANLYNALPSYIKGIKNLKSFKTQVRETFLKAY